MTDRTLHAPFPFILGRGRSGTTLLRAMLDAHPEMAVPNESHFVVGLGKRRRRYELPEGFDGERFLADLLDDWAFKRWRLPPEHVLSEFRRDMPRSFADGIRRAFMTYARHHGKTRYGDKTPGYVMSMDQLAHTFPESRFVHVIRDGRAVALSYLDSPFGPPTLDGNAVYWRRFVRHGRRVGRRLEPERYMEIRYEALVQDPEPELRRLCDFIELSFDPAMLRYFERAGKLLTTLDHGAHANIVRPPTDRLRDWREQMTDSQVRAFESVSGDLLEELGYPLVHPRLPITTRIAGRWRWLRVQGWRIGRRLSSEFRRATRSGPRPA